MPPTTTPAAPASAAPNRPPQTQGGGIFDQLLSFTGSSREFSALLLASAFSTGLLKQGAVFYWNQENNAPDIESAIPAFEGNAPPWLQSLYGSLPNYMVTSRTKIIPRDDRSPVRTGEKVNGRGVKPLSPGEPVFLAFEMTDENQGNAPAFLMNLEMLSALWRSYKRRMNDLLANEDTDVLAPAISVLAAVNAHSRFQKFAMAFCNELASRFKCDRVSLGILKGRYVRMAAMSHTEKFGKGLELVQSIESAMEECLDQDAEIVFPTPSGSAFITRAASELARRFDSSHMISIPIRHEDKTGAVITLERVSDTPPGEREIKLLRLIADLAAPRLVELNRHDRWFGARIAGWLRDKLGVVFGASHTWAKLAALLCLGVGIWLSSATGEYRVEATFVTQPVEQRVMAAPYDGFIAAVHARPGDSLHSGTTLMAELETAELRSQLAMKRAEKTSHEKDAGLARRDNKLAEAQAAEARAEQAQAECTLLEEKIAQAKIIAPLDGVILTGDLTRRVGAPVKQGDTLFEVAPLAQMEADLFVPEDEIADVGEGQFGELAAAGRPDEKIRFQVVRITPMAELIKQKNVFRVQVRLIDPPDWMLPGLEGVAKIDVEERLLLAIWARKAVNWVKIKLWMWW